MENPNTKRYLQIGFIALSVIVLGIGFYFALANMSTLVAFHNQINQVLRPIYYGMVLTFLLLPVHRFFYQIFVKSVLLEKLKIRKRASNGLAIALSLLIAILINYLLLAMLLPQLYESITALFLSIPSDFNLGTPQWLQDFFNKNPNVYNTVAPYYYPIIDAINLWVRTEVMPRLASIEEIMGWAQDLILPYLSSMVSGVSQVVFATVIFAKDILIALIVSVYLLARKSTFSAQGKKLCYAFLPNKWADFLLDELRNAYRILSGFINGKLIDSLIIGLICFIGATLLKFPYAPLIATIIGVTNIIPFFGPFIGAVPCGFLILITNPIQTIYFALFILALQQFDGNILGPKILGESTGLASFWVLFAILFFGGIFGFAGMLFGVPVFATFYSMLSRFVRYQLSKKNMPLETTAYVGKQVLPLSEVTSKEGT